MHHRSSKLKIGAVVLAIILGIGGFWLVLRGLEGLMQSDEEEWGEGQEWPEEHLLQFGDIQYVYTDELDTYLIIGTDSGSEEGDRGEGRNGEMADFLTLLIINKTQETFGFLQLDRDTMTDVPVLDENGEEDGYTREQLCIAHWYGTDAEQRNANTVEAVSEVLGGLEIDGYYCMSMEEIADLNDAVGGVEVTVNEDLTAEDPALTKGTTITLRGDQAEHFLRARMNVGDGTNQERMSRHRQYMTAIYDKVMESLRADAGYIDELYGELEGKVETDTGSGSASKAAASMLEMEGQGILTFDGESSIGDTLGDGVKHAEFEASTESILENLQKLIDLEEE